MSLRTTAKFIILTIGINACQLKKSYTVISGKLVDYKNETITLIPLEDYFPTLEPAGKYLFTTKTDSLGYFTFRSDKIKSGFYQIIHRNYHRLNYDLYIENGDSLFIEQAWETQLFDISGKGAGKLQHLVRDNNNYPRNEKYYDTIRSPGFATEVLFQSFIDSFYNERVNAVVGDESIPQELKSHFINDLYAEKASTLLYHLERRNYVMHGVFTYSYPDTAYYSFLSDIKFDEAFCLNSNAKLLASNYLTNKIRYAFRNREEKAWWDEQFNWKVNYAMNQASSTWNDLVTMSILGEYSAAMSDDNFFRTITRFDERSNTLFKNKSYKDLFQQNAHSFLNLAPGKPAPDFALPDSSGNIIKLSDYKGKIVYIDVWGTWCGPCIQEIPEALKLQKAYKGKPVEFLYVALEYDKNDIERWRNFIAGKQKRFLDEPFTGIHLVAEKQFGNTEMMPYKINYAPTHILIDQNGI